MKISSKIIYIITGFLFLTTGCGDDLISELKDFEANTPPEITAFATDIAADEEILPNMQVNLTVEASDIESDTITYAFSCDYGTFRRQQATADGCTIEFFLNSDCPTSESIPITVTATDSKYDSSTSAIDIGDGRISPSITATWPGTTLNGGDTVTVTFTADCSGFFQPRVDNSVFDETSASFFYERGETASFDITAGTGAEVELTSSGTYIVYLIIIDNFQRQAAVSEIFTVN